jgi:hypothetical protein
MIRLPSGFQLAAAGKEEPRWQVWRGFSLLLSKYVALDFYAGARNNRSSG